MIKRKLLSAIILCSALFAGCSTAASNSNTSQSSSSVSTQNESAAEIQSDNTSQSESVTEQLQISSESESTDSPESSNNSTQDSTVKLEPAESSQNSNTTSTASALDQKGSTLEQTFKDKGWTVYDLEKKNDEYSFDARGSVGSIEVDIESYSSAAAALTEYQDNIEVDTDESFLTTQTYSNNASGDQLIEATLLYNDFNSIYDVEIIDGPNALTISIDNVVSADLDQVKDALKTIGIEF